MATSKTLTPTNVTIQIPAFTDKPDQRVNSNCIDKEADAINALSDQMANLNGHYKQYANGQQTDNDAMSALWDTLTGETSFFGELKAGSRGVYMGYRYNDGLYGSMMFLKYSGQIITMSVQNGSKTFKTITGS